MNIRVDLNTPINDGTEVVFRSPVDCSQVTGLIVYYDGGSQEFMFADAHGYNVGNIDHLFAENVVVKVILDVTTSMAFVQNADTNAYLEGRFDEKPGKVTDDGGVILTDCNNNHKAMKDAVAIGTRIPRAGAKYEVDENGKPIITDESDWRYTEAIGTGSTAAGMGAVAFSRGSKSLGYRTQTGYPPSSEEAAKRPEAVSMSIAGDYPPENMGQAAVAIGSDTVALENNSFAGGHLSVAHGMNSFAFGDGKCEAFGVGAVAFGNAAKAKGHQSVAMGTGCEATLSQAVALGNKAKALGYFSAAFNNETEAAGTAAFAIGSRNKAKGNNSFAMGIDSETSNNATFAGGYAAKAPGVHAFAYGNNTQATGEASACFGYSTKTTGLAQMVVGKYNTTNDNALFIVGNGSATNGNSNALEVTADGGLILRSPNGTRFKITVSDDGTLTTTLV